MLITSPAVSKRCPGIPTAGASWHPSFPPDTPSLCHGGERRENLRDEDALVPADRVVVQQRQVGAVELSVPGVGRELGVARQVGREVVDADPGRVGVGQSGGDPKTAEPWVVSEAIGARVVTASEGSRSCSAAITTAGCQCQAWPAVGVPRQSSLRRTSASTSERASWGWCTPRDRFRIVSVRRCTQRAPAEAYFDSSIFTYPYGWFMDLG